MSTKPWKISLLFYQLLLWHSLSNSLGSIDDVSMMWQFTYELRKLVWQENCTIASHRYTINSIVPLTSKQLFDLENNHRIFDLQMSEIAMVAMSEIFNLISVWNAKPLVLIESNSVIFDSFWSNRDTRGNPILIYFLLRGDGDAMAIIIVTTIIIMMLNNNNRSHRTN